MSSVPRPEDLVEKLNFLAQKGAKEKEENRKNKVPVIYIIVGAGIAVVLLCFMMVPGNKQVPQKSGAQVNKTAAQSPLGLQQPQAEQSFQPQKQLPASAEVIADLDASLVKADVAIKAITQQVSSIDVELHNLTNAAERLGQIGDQDGKKDAERQAAGWGSKRKELEVHYNKWVAYRSELVASKSALTGGK